MKYTYDDQNIFAKILRGEVPNNTAGENDHALAFHDISPIAPVHILIIPKGDYVNYDDFLSHASNEEKNGFNALILDLIHANNLSSENGNHGYRIITNSGAWGMQDVPHYHIHLLAGEAIGPLRAI